jgi:hypothetical protein
LAEQALLSGSKESIKYAEELKKIVAAGKEAELALKSSTSAQKQLDYTLSIFEQTYRDGLLISEQTTDVEEAVCLIATSPPTPICSARKSNTVESDGVTATELVAAAKIA